jgi:SHS2 domain-containing protein
MVLAAGYRIIAHTADVGISAWGADLGVALAAAGRGLFSLTVDLRTVRRRQVRNIEVSAPDREGLVVAWLSELIYLFDTEQLLLRHFEICEITDARLTARAYGEKVNPARHRLKTAVKAATYHQLEVACDGSGCRLRVILDI